MQIVYRLQSPPSVLFMWINGVYIVYEISGAYLYALHTFKTFNTKIDSDKCNIIHAKDTLLAQCIRNK